MKPCRAGKCCEAVCSVLICCPALSFNQLRTTARMALTCCWTSKLSTPSHHRASCNSQRLGRGSPSASAMKIWCAATLPAYRPTN